MNSSLDHLLQKTLTFIRNPDMSDVELLGQLTKTAAKIKSLQDQSGLIERETENISIFLERFNPSPASPPFELVIPSEDKSTDHQLDGQRRAARKIRIEIDWTKAGKSWQPEILSDNLSSSTIARFIERLFEVYGEAVLERLSTLRVNRGMLLSKNPANDFKNGTDGSIYKHREIARTGYAVLTNTSTAEKVADLKKACEFLRLPKEMVKISEAAK